MIVSESGAQDVMVLSASEDVKISFSDETKMTLVKLLTFDL